MPRVAVFGPHPLLTVTVEAQGGRDDVHLHAGGQGVWVARMAAELGAAPVLCAFAGGEPGSVLLALPDGLPPTRRIVPTRASSGCYVVDRRSGERRLVAHAPSTAPTRHEVDDLVALTTAAALESDVLVIGNAYPGDLLPVGVYAQLAADVGANGTPVIADLSSPRVDAVVTGAPALVKLNDWELAGYVCGPVDGPRLREAAERLRDAGARRVLVTRAAEPALFLDGDEPLWIVPPRFERGAREGCGDAMVGAIAATIAAGHPWLEAVRVGAAAGAANFLRHGLGTGARAVVEDLTGRVAVRAYDAVAA
ncbi:MAG TPA: PfkB family carbohydrate kinase [Baekduia sp.]|nr:PfkB family carbohydrate kinase [Baekduia sp.]